MLNALQIFTAFAGLLAIALAVKYIWFFHGSGREVGRSMVFMLIEQVVTATCTFVFSLNSLATSLLGMPPSTWNSIDPMAAIVLRLIMFGAMIHSTLHLSRSVRNIIEKEANK